MKAPLFTAVLLCCAALEASGAAARPLPDRHAPPARVATLDLARRIDINQINLGVTNVGIHGFDVGRESGREPQGGDLRGADPPGGTLRDHQGRRATVNTGWLVR